MIYPNLPKINEEIFHSLKQRPRPTIESIQKTQLDLIEENSVLADTVKVIAVMLFEDANGYQPHEHMSEKHKLQFMLTFHYLHWLLSAVDSQIGADKLKELIT